MRTILKWETHWFQLRGNTLLTLKDDLLINLILMAINKAGNLNRVCKAINASYPDFLYVLKRKNKMISVKKLRNLVNFLEINYGYLNDKISEIKKGRIISIKNPRLPFNLNTKEGAQLLACIVSDGTIYVDKKARGVFRTKYSSSDQESINRFIDNINSVFGEVHIQKEFSRGNTYLKIGSSIIGEALIKVGAILGNKTKQNKGIPWLIKRNQNLIKDYIRNIFGDEGSSAGSSNYPPYIITTRYNHINSFLSKEELAKLDKCIEPVMKEIIFPTKHITKSITYTKIRSLAGEKIDNKIRKNCVPKLLLDEKEMLDLIGIDSRLWVSRLTKTQLGFYGIAVNLIISRKASVIKFYKEVGFSLSRKQNKLENSLAEVNWV